MALIHCTACDHRISDMAVACPSCGHPSRPDRRGALNVLGSVAGTYISATTLASLALGVAMFVCTAAVLITLILHSR
ncbi:hypothetical protein [Methylobacterium haplocladii]|uniref:Zinc-ribbon domain-containing protein n=1 Tax=Methylobacterium haplocladii TaxID=1176176 RepID=A0A512IRJ0_9HYPH|nr:hypothetical protein [Methylobacterium haplocladii]GEP00239.1 hypothetical protein MHA02_26260 [Methylobacterium haplocladii]GJD84253.1 hypothetical protein HPGCJGGD_2128 [Methylobacterium haplocladii]GLS60868.1 hypothetical protein GCM10007887_35570 [Methylobacterium haplocladii]